MSKKMSNKVTQLNQPNTNNLSQEDTGDRLLVLGVHNQEQEAEEVNPDDVESLDDTTTSTENNTDDEETHNVPPPVKLSQEADQFLRTLASLKKDGKIPLRKKELGGKAGLGLYGPLTLLPILQAEGVPVPSKEVLAEAVTRIPGVRSQEAWVKGMVRKARAAVQLSSPDYDL